MRGLNIAVAGCGPAGMATALLLKRDGHKVTIYERFEQAKPVGSGLIIQPTGQAILAELDLLNEVVGSGSKIDRIYGRVEPSGRAVLDVRYCALGADKFGIGIHRAALFETLYSALVKAGISVETGQTVSHSEPCASSRRLHFLGGAASPRFNLIVDTLGTGSPLVAGRGRPLRYGALWASLNWVPDSGFDDAALEQRYVAARIMVGILPIGKTSDQALNQIAFFWSLPADRLDAWRSAGLEVWKEEVRTLWPATACFLDQLSCPDQLCFARYVHRTERKPADTALIHIGDAWHSTSPQLGQGANMALLDAWALAKALREQANVADALGAAIKMRRSHVMLYQAISALFTPVYQSDSRLLPILRDWVAGPLSRIWPAPRILAAMVNGQIGGPLKRLGF